MPVRFLNIANNLESLIAGLLIIFLLLVMGGSPHTEAQEKTRGNVLDKTDVIARGKYLVEGVAGCSDCHTPRDNNGETDRTKWLQGAPVFLQPAQAVPGWPIVAPRIAHLPRGSDAAMITLLTTGNWTDGKPLRRPMPRFHMTRDDAQAVLAYLKSL